MQTSLFGSPLVFDLETQYSFDEVGGRGNLQALKISVVGMYDYGTDQYRVFEERELDQFEAALKAAANVIGFNHINFDLPVLEPYLKSLAIKDLPTLDIMKEIERVVGHRVSLESVATATLGTKKTGHGLDAIRYYREGNMKALKDYCLHDVKITKELYDFGRKNGKLSFLSKSGATSEVAVKWG